MARQLWQRTLEQLRRRRCSAWHPWGSHAIAAIAPTTIQPASAIHRCLHPDASAFGLWPPRACRRRKHNQASPPRGGTGQIPGRGIVTLCARRAQAPHRPSARGLRSAASCKEGQRAAPRLGSRSANLDRVLAEADQATRDSGAGGGPARRNGERRELRELSGRTSTLRQRQRAEMLERGHARCDCERHAMGRSLLIENWSTILHAQSRAFEGGNGRMNGARTFGESVTGRHTHARAPCWCFRHYGQ